MKKVIATVLASCLALGMLSGCTSAKAQPKKTIGVSMNAADEYCTALLDSIEKDAKAQGYNVISTNASGSANKQISDMESLVVKKPDVIIMRAVDPGASSPAAAAAMKAGIKLEIIDLPIFDSDYNVHLTSDQGRVGELIGQNLNEWLKADSKRVANIGYIKGNDIPPTAPRRTKLLETAKGAKELVNMTTTPEWSAASAQSIANDWLTPYPNMNVIVGMSDELALGAIQALKTAKKNLSDYLIYGCDGTKNGLLAVKNGEMTATVITDPVAWGKKSVDIAVELATGSKDYKVKSEVDGTDAMVLVTKENVDKYMTK